MAVFKRRLTEWCLENNIDDSFEQVFAQLLATKSEREIAEMFGCTVSGVRYWMRKLSLLDTRGTFMERLHELGYDSLPAFFTAPENRRTKQTFKGLSEKTGFSYQTVSRWYRIFLKELTQRKLKERKHDQGR